MIIKKDISLSVLRDNNLRIYYLYNILFVINVDVIYDVVLKVTISFMSLNLIVQNTWYN